MPLLLLGKEKKIHFLFCIWLLNVNIFYIGRKSNYLEVCLFMDDREFELEQQKLELEKQKLAANVVNDKDGYATASLICGCIGFIIPVLSVIGLILGYCSKTPDGAKNGILVSWISFALWLVFLVCGLGLIGYVMAVL
jgi:uncharacterized membrane protein